MILKLLAEIKPRKRRNVSGKVKVKSNFQPITSVSALLFCFYLN
jgi:hypothetical protein